MCPLRLGRPVAGHARPIRSSANRDYAAEKPAPDPVFDAYRRFFVYDRTPVKAAVTSTYDANPDWRVESVSFPAGYGGESIPARCTCHGTPTAVPDGALPGWRRAVEPSRESTGGRLSADIPLRHPQRPRRRLPDGQGHVRARQRSIQLRRRRRMARCGATTRWPSTRTSPARSTTWRPDPTSTRTAVAFLGQSRSATLSPIVLALEPGPDQGGRAADPWLLCSLTRQPAGSRHRQLRAARVRQPV